MRTLFFDQPVEAAQIASADFNIREGRTVLAKAAQTETLGFFRTVIQRKLADDVRKEVAELLIVAAVLSLHLTVQTAADHFVG